MLTVADRPGSVSECGTSPSWQVRCLSFVIWLVAFRSRRASPESFLKHVKSTWESCNEEVILSEDYRASYTKETLENGSQTWQVFHIRPQHQMNTAKKVILYWHGGGFHTRNPSLDSKAVLAMALDTGCPIVYPLYTLAPVGTAAQCVQGGLKLLLSVYRDDRYRDHEIIITGASAGAWIALRLVLALGEIVLDKSTVRLANSQEIIERTVDSSLTSCVEKSVGLDIARRVSEIVLQSPWVDTDLKDPSDRYHESKDVLLNPTTLRMSASIWAYGSHKAFPDYDFGLPLDDAGSTDSTDEKPLSDPTYSPMYGIDLLRGLNLHGCDIHLSQYIGTEDLFYGQNLRMERYLAECGIPHTLRIYPGVGHVMAASFLPECHDMFADVKARFGRRMGTDEQSPLLN